MNNPILKNVMDNSTVGEVTKTSLKLYESFENGAKIHFDFSTNSFTFKGIEITVDEAIFLCNEMPPILLKHAVVKPEDWRWLHGSCGEVPIREVPMKDKKKGGVV